MSSIQREERAAVNRCRAVRCGLSLSVALMPHMGRTQAMMTRVTPRCCVAMLAACPPPPELIGRSPFPMQLKEEHFCQRLRTEHALFDIYCSSTPIRRGDGNLSVAHLKPARDLIAFRVLEADFLTHASFVQGTPWVHHRGCNHAG